jgi:hypothetical protein
MRHHRSRFTTAGALAGLVALGGAGAADAKITGYPREYSAAPLARAMIRKPAELRRSVFAILPPGATPAAVSTTRLAGFPRTGGSFAILSTGNAKIASRKNTSSQSGSTSKGLAVRGARDVVIMRVGIQVPPGHNCLTFNFRFLSEEFPEFVDDIFNDTFVAELDRSTWRSQRGDPGVVAPRNFAVDGEGHPIRVNKVGDTTMSAAQARGTTYDGATRILRASTPVTPGRHNLYLSIFDQGDRIYDSAVFLDNLGTTHAATCRTGVVLQGK